MKIDPVQIERLSAAEQEMVAEFIAFLCARKKSASDYVKPARSLRDEPFFGMWRNRPDVQDSTGWVRRLRENQEHRVE